MGEGSLGLAHEAWVPRAAAPVRCRAWGKRGRVRRGWAVMGAAARAVQRRATMWLTCKPTARQLRVAAIQLCVQPWWRLQLRMCNAARRASKGCRPCTC